METAKKIKANKKKKVANAMTENEVKEMIMPKINDEERDQIINNINNLGTDELSDLVREKIINVVKDEHQREKEEREFRTVLKNDIQDPTLRMDTNEDNIGSKKVKKKGGSIDTGDDGVDMDPIEGDEIEDTKKDGSSKSSFKKSGSSKDTKTAKDNVGSYIAIGIAGIFFFHMVENIGMTIGLLPITGVPLPFVSYGGSSMITNFICIGLLLNISSRRQKAIYVE